MPTKTATTRAKPAVISQKISTINPSTILIRPHVTEKTSHDSPSNLLSYAFRVNDRATKTQIKEAVKALYGIKVRRVRVVNIPPKQRGKMRQRAGWRKGFRKALVILAKGQKLDLMK